MGPTWQAVGPAGPLTPRGAETRPCGSLGSAGGRGGQRRCRCRCCASHRVKNSQTRSAFPPIPAGARRRGRTRSPRGGLRERPGPGRGAEPPPSPTLPGPARPGPPPAPLRSAAGHPPLAPLPTGGGRGTKQRNRSSGYCLSRVTDCVRQIQYPPIKLCLHFFSHFDPLLQSHVLSVIQEGE